MLFSLSLQHFQEVIVVLTKDDDIQITEHDRIFNFIKSLKTQKLIKSIYVMYISPFSQLLVIAVK